MIGFFEFHTAHSEVLLTACADQLLYNLSLIKSCSACVKQNTTVKTAGDACSLLAKYTLSDLVGQHPSLLIINFAQFISLFSYQRLIALFYKSTIKSNCMLL